MRIKDLSEGKWGSDFNKYRQLGQNPTQLAGHLAKKAVGAASSDNVQTKSTSTAKKSPFDMLSKQEAKTILSNVLNGVKLEPDQIAKLQQIYNRL